MNNAIPISAIILAHNAEDNIGHCLASIGQIPDVFIVDSGSIDRTVKICESHGARIFHHPYVNHADQWQWALDNLPIQTLWVLTLDADFVVTPGLMDRLLREIG